MILNAGKLQKQRCQCHYKVLFGQLNVHAKANIPFKANGQIVRNNYKEAVINISKTDAENKGRILFANKINWLSAPTELVWIPRTQISSEVDPANMALCYQVKINSNYPTRGECYFINAASGELVLEIKTIYDCNATTAATVWYGTSPINTSLNASNNLYELKDDCTPTVIEVLCKMSGNIVLKYTSANNTWTGLENGVTALVVAKQTVEYFKNVHARNSWDNANHRVVFLIDDINCNGGGCTGNNAYSGDTITFGNYGTPSKTDDYYTLDVFGHEFTHNLTDNAIPGGLPYVGESGALNESFSDIFGNCVEINQEGSTPTGDVWLVGEDRFNTGGSLWLRDMRDPNHANSNTTQSSPQPKKFNGLNWQVTNCTPSNANDYCGVHTNSGVQN